jgi:hypothetical protein
MYSWNMDRTRKNNTGGMLIRFWYHKNRFERLKTKFLPYTVGRLLEASHVHYESCSIARRNFGHFLDNSWPTRWKNYHNGYCKKLNEGVRTDRCVVTFTTTWSTVSYISDQLPVFNEVQKSGLPLALGCKGYRFTRNI